VDVALWDIAAQAAGLPLYQFIGECRTSLPVYASSLFLPKTGDYLKEMRAYKKRGFPAYKVHPPGPWRKDMEIHSRAPPGRRRRLRFDERSRRRIFARRSDPHRARFGAVELSLVRRTVPRFELAKYAKLCAALDIPICGTETTRGGPLGVAQAITFNAVDIVRADVSWKPGVTGTLKIAHLAEAHGMRCEIHCTTMGFMDMANLHVSCAIKNCEYFELLVPEEPFRFPMKDNYPIDKNGRAHVPQKPGVGVELDWDAIDRTCVEHKITRAK